MNNSWLKVLIPKVKVKVSSLADVSRMRADKIRIYNVKKVEDGYIVTIRKGTTEEADLVGAQSIYKLLTVFVLPVAFIWAMLLVAVQFITIDFEIRGNLVHEDISMVSEIVEPYFINLGPFAFFKGNNDDLIADIALAFHDYIWIDIQTVGSRLFIDVYDTQVTDPQRALIPLETVYSRASGVVTKIDVSGCRPLVAVDQVVDVGQALISCYTPTGFGTEMARIEGNARGAIYADVWYMVTLEFPRVYALRMVTGSRKSDLFLNVGDQRLRIWGAGVDYEDYSERNRVFNPLEFLNISPITLERVHYYEISDIILTNEIDNVRNRADGLVKSELSTILEHEFELIELRFLSLEENGDLVRIKYHATVRENIANTQ